MLILLVGLFWFESNFYQQYTFYLDLASVLVNIGFAVIGLIAVRKEMRALLIVFVVLSWIVPAYLTWRFVLASYTYNINDPKTEVLTSTGELS
jgi:hypothetical protein